jgi:lipoprotein-anchoring transpeptidase ErfK/SrfK
VLDELNDITYSVPASHLRLIPDDELTPITPEIPFEKKRIEVSLKTQQLVCFEYDEPVFTTTISSGRIYNNVKVTIPTRTPAGEYNIAVKMPSKHMGNGSLASDIEAYELPGVAWNCFFTRQGHAFHGTYWHDNFGVPMSSGCINMRTDEAKWLFRWCLPSAAADQISPLTLDKKGYGTPVVILA